MQVARTLVTAALAATLAVGLAAPAAVAGPAQPDRRATYKPTLKAGAAKVVSAHRVLLSGTVRPARKGGTVVVQTRLSGSQKWIKVARLKMTRKGAFSFRDKPHKIGLRYYRVVVPKSKGVKAGKSASVKVTVYAWKDLLKVTPRSQEYTYQGSGSIDGTTYDGIYGTWDYGNAGIYDWNLSRDCWKIRGRFGNSDASDALAVAHVSLEADGKAVYAKSFGLTTSEVRTISILGAFRVAFRWTSTNPDGTPEDQSGASAVLAAPEVLCAS
ncbi:hypothetical protein [Nocardioides sp. URHA0020]|uniref:hypothetical protein n=1 Tax=Nocardioides sp. URHA0020 TaxID=1380392 RepID=UPI00048BC3E3|nr:hypothetical protein [Nocardioides sp. URHA0020]